LLTKKREVSAFNVKSTLIMYWNGKCAGSISELEIKAPYIILVTQSVLLMFVLGYPQQEEVVDGDRVAKNELLSFKPWLQDRLKYIHESGRKHELVEEIESISFYLEIMDDPFVVR